MSTTTLTENANSIAARSLRIATAQEKNLALKPKDSTRPLVIGFSGKKRHGKDFGATLLTEAASELGYVVYRRAFADALKDEVAAFLSVSYPDRSHADLEESMSKDPYGIEFRKECRRWLDTDGKKEEFRLLLQWWGTEYRRKNFGADYWVRQVETWIEENVHEPNAIVVITDCRFPDEADFVLDICDGYMIRVQRPDLWPTLGADQHPSETALDDYERFSAQARNVVTDDKAKSAEDYALVMRFILADALEYAWGCRVRGEYLA